MEVPGPGEFPRERVKLIFNPAAGAARLVPVDILEVIHELLSLNLTPEIFLIEPGCDLAGAVRNALDEGIRLFLACGGDGTVSSIARLLTGSDAVLAIMPAGTQNNTALSLGIPNGVREAIALLRTGHKIEIDMGLAACGNRSTPFLEVCSIGLISDLFPAVDDIQHGNAARVVDLVTALAVSPPAEIHLTLEDGQVVHSHSHLVLISNMPVIGLHYKVGKPDAFRDGLLDVIFFAGLTKLELLGFVFQGVGSGAPPDPRIRRYQVRKVEIETNPAMPVMADGEPLGEGSVRIEVWKNALTMVSGEKPGAKKQKS